MIKRWLTASLASTAVALSLAAPASADFGFSNVEVSFTGKDGAAVTQAGSHPYEMTTSLDFNTVEGVPEAEFKDLVVDLPPGFVGDPSAVPTCSNIDFLIFTKEEASACSDDAAVGVVGIRQKGSPVTGDFGAVYNLEPPPGAAAKLGFHVLVGVAVTLEVGVRQNSERNLFATLSNVAQAEPVTGSELTLWGNPADPSHDAKRGNCVPLPLGSCPTNVAPRPFLTMPRSCTGPLVTTFTARSWQDPSTWVTAKATSNEGLEPNPIGMSGCDKLGFAPQISAQPTSNAAESPTGLDFKLDVEDLGLTNPTGIAHSDIRKAVVTLPEGMTINPSQAEGLAGCSPQDFAREQAGSAFGAGCPAASKIGTVEVESKLLEGEILKGSVFVATPHDNPFDSLIALYMTIKSPELGIYVGLAGKVEPDPATGQILTSFDDLPQLPFSHFRFHFREGGRSPLITPPRCGEFTTQAVFTPWANPTAPLATTAPFQIETGVGGGSCPPAGTPPFEPGFEAGSVSNDAASYSPFGMRLTRRDGDQDLTRFDATLPPGLLAKLAGVSQCPQSQIAAAKSRTGKAELAAPSCPASSQIGTTLAGAGVGSQLTYVPGRLYLAGPFAGAPLSVAAIVPAVAGPFDVGTVIVQEALDLDPRTAEVIADGSRSDPIPHILAGIPLRVREIRVDVDRPEFTLNPTDCDPLAVRADIWGGGSGLFSSADDAPVARSQRYLAANCARLGFAPRLDLRLKGGSRRGDHPSLRAVLRPRPGDANLSRTVVRLPRSAFLDQAHIRTVCTRVQFATDACPNGAIYGRVRAFSPLLDAPLEGPAYLRSSDNQLPDLVFDLKGIVDIETSARIDSIRGGIRATFPAIPDAPISKVIASFPGGQKGLIVNSRSLCSRPSRASVTMDAHSEKRSLLRPPMRAACKKRR